MSHALQSLACRGNVSGPLPALYLPFTLVTSLILFVLYPSRESRDASPVALWRPLRALSRCSVTFLPSDINFPSAKTPLYTRHPNISLTDICATSLFYPLSPWSCFPKKRISTRFVKSCRLTKNQLTYVENFHVDNLHKLLHSRISF
ncbi:hypothetical protein L228DRAFT_25734 [Xylona heveae TC161]|uniref:Uncharacterized protein n=1 Tax=Xylona heveae (strain CBS 132557 / TC161) TaxID=1328760 RepID=A0A165ADR1_XYLHT|nr:hypothetical protein L228DRAFT_25734 [Xylona heveae TC161]KZF20309.1 hypothetical protein L228DRAFT_25734 [Xylona heveae TC161]